MSKKITSYTAMVDIKVSTTIEIKAETFEKALEEAKTLKVLDVISFDGDHNDSEIEVVGIFK